MSTGFYPTKWKSSYIDPIYKAEDKSDVKNYRRMDIMNTITKFFESILVDKLTISCQNSIAEDQYGFISGRSSCTNLSLYPQFIA